MLFTRCPGCQTTFRITADTLRVANGAVRCGTCATVFSAFSGLQQNAPTDGAADGGARQDDEVLSPTMQTQELAGLEELAGPALDEALDGAGSDAPQNDLAENDLAENDLAENDDLEVPIVDTPAAVHEESAQATETSPPPERDEDAADEALATEDELEPVAEPDASDSSNSLQFDVPTDDWALVLNEIEQSAEGDGGAEESTSGDHSSVDDASEADEFWNVGDPAAAESWTEIEMSDDESVGHERVAVGELEAPPDIDAPVGDAQTEAEVSAILDAEPDISDEQVDATLSAEPDAELVEVLESGLSSQRTDSERTPLWAMSCAALALVLALQVIHHYRAPLASQRLVGPLLQGTYDFVGIELLPDWDLDQYEILNWVATEAGLGNLRITAQIRNNGPRTQPYPHIHLELKDRWEAVVGSRVFEPGEYLQPDADIGGAMIAGVTVPADFAVVDPGEDAYGFELDVCIQREAGRLSCSSQRVFE